MNMKKIWKQKFSHFIENLKQEMKQEKNKNLIVCFIGFVLFALLAIGDAVWDLPFFIYAFTMLMLLVLKDILSFILLSVWKIPTRKKMTELEKIHAQNIGLSEFHKSNPWLLGSCILFIVGIIAILLICGIIQKVQQYSISLGNLISAIHKGEFAIIFGVVIGTLLHLLIVDNFVKSYQNFVEQQFDKYKIEYALKEYALKEYAFKKAAKLNEAKEINEEQSECIKKKIENYLIDIKGEKKEFEYIDKIVDDFIKGEKKEFEYIDKIIDNFIKSKEETTGK